MWKKEKVMGFEVRTPQRLRSSGRATVFKAVPTANYSRECSHCVDLCHEVIHSALGVSALQHCHKKDHILSHFLQRDYELS
jgi:hypothetical protein